MEIFLKITSLDAFMHDTLERGGRALSAQIPVGGKGTCSGVSFKITIFILANFLKLHIFRET
jgi:hypothetical protein